MTNLDDLNQYRIKHPFAGVGDSQNGAFKIQIDGKKFIVIASNGGDWEHVSVSPMKAKGCATWKEMCVIKRMFFNDDEAVVQYHPPYHKNINIVDNCLHLWRPIKENILMPPEWMV